MKLETRGPDRRTEPGERGLHPRGHHLGVGPQLAGDDDDEAPLPIDAALAEPRLRRVSHPAEIAEAEHDALPLPHDGGRQRHGGRCLAFGAHRQPLARLVDHATAAQAAGQPCGVGHLRDPDAVEPEPLGIELNLELALLAAEHGDLGHAGHREQPGSEHPIHEGALVHRRDRIGGDADDQHGARRGGERGEDGRLHSRREPHGHLPEPLGQCLSRLVDVHPLAEHRGHHGEALNGLRANRRDALHSVDRVFDRLGDLELDLLRREPRGLGLNRDLRRGELGKDVERRTPERVRSDHHERRGQPQHHAAMADGAADEPPQHAGSVVTRRPPRPPSPGPGTPPRAAPARR